MLAVERLAHGCRWRRRHPAEKLILASGLLVLALVLPAFPGAVLVLITAVVLALAGARLPAGAYARIFAVPVAFLAAGAAVLAVTPGPDAHGWLLTVTPATLGHAGQVTVRALAAVAALLLLALTTPVTDLLNLISRTRMPPEITDLLLFIHRFVMLLQATLTTGRDAQASRLGYLGFGRSIRSTGLLMAGLLPRALDRASHLERGLAARGYDGTLRLLPPEAGISKRFVAATLIGHAAIVTGTLAAASALGQPWL